MPDDLTPAEMAALVRQVFAPRPGEARIALLVDLPGGARPDHDRWRERRHLASAWTHALDACRGGTGLAPALFLYPNVGRNNADLPGGIWPWPEGRPIPASGGDLPPGEARPLDEVLSAHPLVIALTELSATAPLKLRAPRLGFRAATMPGFTRAMLPALRLDFDEVHRRVSALARLLTAATAADLAFSVEGGEPAALHLDLRDRRAHASSGLLRQPGTAGNLPSGEAFIVPYEGERPGDPSLSAGVLPVEVDREVLRFEIAGNRARRVLGEGPAARAEAAHLARVPARGNVAELGLGVLAGLGVAPVGETLLDEKLGLHVAFGRSDHFGGQVGPEDFADPAEVMHQDHVYLPALQPRVRAEAVDLLLPGGERRRVVEGGRVLAPEGAA